ncbi:MAG TPA: ABC transporter permease [Eoetvoesiella sp.]|uniref:ABC transporter permease n=1 Tax=Eoetvoesiella sp. TaxID=1966355 RepID=UPI002C6D1DE9|nr:ABC transporter permease [Eoetvoesiella sp.]HWK60288.1 ABC transporter permease [Eoetvoesiella sp.]
MPETKAHGAAKQGNVRKFIRGTERYAAVVIIDIVLVIVFSTALPGFLSVANISNLLTGSAVLWVVSLGMTFVVVSAGIDLAVAAQMGLSGYLLATLLLAGTSSWLAISIVLVFSAACGALVNGVLIGKAGLNFFVVTLGSMTAFTGVVNIWSDTRTLAVDDSVILAIGYGTFLGVPIAIWIMLAALAIAVYIQRWTYFGRDVFATGGSIEAARLSGIRTSRILIGVYTLSAVCAGIAALIQVGQLGAASPLITLALPLQAAAAVLLGGTAFSGGVGGVVGTAAGVLFIGILQNGLGLAGISSYWQQVVTGIILVLAVGLDPLRKLLGDLRRRRRLVRQS